MPSFSQLAQWHFPFRNCRDHTSLSFKSSPSLPRLTVPLPFLGCLYVCSCTVAWPLLLRLFDSIARGGVAPFLPLVRPIHFLRNTIRSFQLFLRFNSLSLSLSLGSMLDTRQVGVVYAQWRVSHWPMLN